MSEKTSAMLKSNLPSVFFETVFFLVINITAIIGNTFVILAIWRNVALRKITNWYISLAVADLFISVTCMPLSLGVAITGEWIYGDVTCQIQGHLMLVWALFSLTTVAVTANNRYFRVVYPIRYQTIFTKRVAIITAVLCLVLSAIAAVGLIFIIGAQFQFGPHTFCTPDIPDQETKKTAVVTVFMTFMISSLATVTFCYFKVYRTVRQHVILVAPNLHPETMSQGRTGNKSSCRIEEINATKMVFVVLLVFCVIWLPLSIIGTLYVCDFFLPRWTHLMYDYLFCLTAATNPLIFGLMNNAFRNEYLRIVRCKDPS